MNTPVTADLPAGRIRYTEQGEGHPVVFVHGLLVNSTLWRNVTPKLAATGYRCITPDWPLGSHRLPMPPPADLTPPALADLITDFLVALDLNDVTLVANDTGGALTQLAMTRNPQRIGRVVLPTATASSGSSPRPSSAYRSSHGYQERSGCRPRACVSGGCSARRSRMA
ncbi:MAG: alpha/beta fold hydrolase [Sciscionella sp.]